MQGPFTLEMNVATMRQYGCKVIVTKDTGKPGGFSDKAECAALGYKVIVVRRPAEETGITVEEAEERRAKGSRPPRRRPRRKKVRSSSCHSVEPSFTPIRKPRVGSCDPHRMIFRSRCDPHSPRSLENHEYRPLCSLKHRFNSSPRRSSSPLGRATGSTTISSVTIVC